MSIPIMLLILITIDIKSELLSEIDKKIIRQEIENSTLDFPVVRLIIADRNERVARLLQKYGESLDKQGEFLDILEGVSSLKEDDSSV